MTNDEIRPEDGQKTPDHSTNMLNGLFGIVNDLWGESQTDEEDLTPPAAVPASVPAAKAAEAKKPQEAEKPAEEEVPRAPSFAEFCRGADETVEWTEVLTGERDPYFPPELQLFFAEKAEQVLSGNLKAYADVLNRVQPLADLQPYTQTCRIIIHTPDRITVRFTPVQDVDRFTPEIRRGYLAGVALRCARDIFALLPVEQVTIAGEKDGKTLVNVTFPRDALHKVHFTYSDPFRLVTASGGVIAE